MIAREGTSIKGQILKGIGGFYYIKAEDGAVYECRAKGKFRNTGEKPLPGDFVLFTPASQDGSGSVDEILPRRNALVRPAVANLDQLLIVVSAAKPALDEVLVDKLLLYAQFHELPVILGINKIDQDKKGRAQQICQRYAKSGARLLAFSVATGEGLAPLKEQLRGKCTCLAGQSAVGKSSLVNALAPHLALETGGMSKKTARGRHTTRHTELLDLKEIDAILTDTPGFSILEVLEMEPEQLRNYYPEFYGIQCRFDSCLHYKEPECNVMKAVQAGEISAARYEGYIRLLEELFERRDKRYV